MADSIGETLKQIRTKMGYLSARSFYMALEGRVDLQFNYSYYMKIEADQTSPSEKVISQLASLLPEADGDRVVAAYCQSLFPKQMARIINQGTQSSQRKKIAQAKPLKSVQQELTERQIDRLALSKDHYFLFLLLTLARHGLTRKELESYQFENLEAALTDLKDVKLAYTEKDLTLPAFPEYAFPKSTPSLKELYKKLDSYDGIRDAFFKLKKEKSASFFKRISPRQIEIILSHLELLFQTIRVADETDTNYNTEVVSLNLTLHSGDVKG